jgi:hypothetical protein
MATMNKDDEIMKTRNMPKRIRARATTAAGIKIDREIEVADILTPMIAIGPDDPEGGFSAMFQRVAPVLDLAGSGAQLSVNGYDNDPRELGEIPEAVALLRRFVEVGGLGMLVERSTSGLGALNAWGIATGQITGAGPYKIENAPFYEAWQTGCRKFNETTMN